MAEMADPILVVDDDVWARETMAQLLHLEGFAPVTAANGLEALEFLRAGGRAKVILLDLVMPVMDGWTFCEEQQRDPRFAAIPVVVLTATEGSRTLAATASFRKPFDYPRVINFVRDLCGRPAGR